MAARRHGFASAWPVLESGQLDGNQCAAAGGRATARISHGSCGPSAMVVSVWFWVALNEELADQPAWKALPLTVRLWRWALRGFGVISVAMTTTGLSCLQGGQTASCLAWLEAPQGLHGLAATVFDFIFGGQWTEAFAAFVGYVALVAYLAGLLQWLLIRLPRYGRVAGDF